MFNEKIRRYAIRKLTVGAASVLVGLAFLGVDKNQVHADTNDDQAKAADAATTQDGQGSKQNVQATAVPEHIVVTANNSNQNIAQENQQVDASDAASKSAATPQVSEAGKTTDKVSEDQKSVANTQNADKSTTAVQDEKQEKIVDPQKTKQDNNQTKVEKELATNQTVKPETDAKTQAQVSVHVNYFNETTGHQFYHVDLSGKAGDTKNIYINYRGFKILNPEVVTEAIPADHVNVSAAQGVTFVLPNKSQDITIHYAQLAPIEVDYNDDQGNRLYTLTYSSENATSESPFSSSDDIVTSKFQANAIAIPGYELVSEPSITTTYNKVWKKNDLTPQVISFTYKKVQANAEKGLPQTNHSGDAGNVPDGSGWSQFAPGIDVDMVMDNYGVGNNHYTKDVSNWKEKYEKQGATLTGINDFHYDSDKMNRLEGKGSVNFVPHLPVTVKYVDQNGKEIAPSEILSYNKANTNQANNGIDPSNHWYPNGEWTSKDKTINGYKLNHVDGVTSGKFTVFNYTVTYVYDQTTNGSLKYIDDTTGNVLNGSINFTDETVGNKINYTTADKIKTFENQGYELVSSNFKDGQESFNADPNKNNFEVHLKHIIIPVTPDKPGKPGEPVDPKNPDGPKYPSNWTPSDLTKNITRTVTYVDENGNKVFNPVTQTVSFQGKGILDLVTGNLVNLNSDGSIKDQNGSYTWTSENDKYSEVSGIDTKSYSVIKVNEENTRAKVDMTNGAVDGETVTPKNQNSTVVITLKKNDTPDPAKDKGSITVTVYDNTDKKTVDGYDKTSGEVETGTKFDYNTAATISDLENKGYKVINSDVKVPNEVTKGKQVITIYVEHTYIPVTPDKPGKPGDPINPNDPDGPKYPKGTSENDLVKAGTQTVHYVGAGKDTPKDNVQTINYGRVVIVDKVTGEIVKTSDWTRASEPYTSVTTPNIPGYSADKSVVGGDPVDPNGNLNREYTVTYTKNTNPVTPNQPTNPTNPTQPTSPDQPTTPVTPNQPTSPQPSQPTSPVPDTPETVTPHAQTPDEPEDDNETVAPHAQTGDDEDSQETVKPHAGKVVTPKQTTSTKTPFVNTSIKKSNTQLPQTGEDDDANAYLGLAIASLAMIGLAGVKKRKN